MSPACRASSGAIPPRLVAPSTWGELDRVPLMMQFPRLLAVRPRFGAVRPRFGAVRPRFGAVRPQFGAVRRPHRRPLRR